MDSNIIPSLKLDQIMLAHKEPPLISLFMKTHRHSPENQQDLLRFRNLLNQAKESLDKVFEKRQTARLIQHLEALVDDPSRSLWRHAKDGLAVLASNDGVHVYQTDYPLDDLVIVAESFHIKPLIKYFQFGADYYLLLLSMDKTKLMRGDFISIEELSFPEDVKIRFDELFNDFDNTSNVSAGTFSGPMHVSTVIVQRARTLRRTSLSTSAM
ncbi:MAG: hypothetical protein GX562_00355 [Coriobacteriaceae bacterium]|nr:hypothetical protein [Coriobacteriaceae bacterium]